LEESDEGECAPFIVLLYRYEQLTRNLTIMVKEVTIWYDKEGDYLEVLFERKEGFFRETENDAVMEKVDNEGNIIGFSILKVRALKDQKTLSVILKSHNT